MTSGPQFSWFQSTELTGLGNAGVLLQAATETKNSNLV